MQACFWLASDGSVGIFMNCVQHNFIFGFSCAMKTRPLAKRVRRSDVLQLKAEYELHLEVEVLEEVLEAATHQDLGILEDALAHQEPRCQ